MFHFSNNTFILSGKRLFMFHPFNFGWKYDRKTRSYKIEVRKFDTSIGKMQ